MIEHVGIYIKTKEAWEKDGFGKKMKYHFHITTVHKYRFFVYCLYSSYIYLCRVVMWKWYLILLPKPSCSYTFRVLMTAQVQSDVNSLLVMSGSTNDCEYKSSEAIKHKL